MALHKRYILNKITAEKGVKKPAIFLSSLILQKYQSTIDILTKWGYNSIMHNNGYLRRFYGFLVNF